MHLASRLSRRRFLMRLSSVGPVACIALGVLVASKAGWAQAPSPRPRADLAGLERKVADLERQLASIRKELQELRRGRSAQPDAKRSKPDRVAVAAFPLKHLKSAEVAEMLQEALGKKNAFVGVDGRDN